MACAEYFTDLKLGGDGRVVEVDEAVFMKRKYRRGRNKQVIWILGFAERSLSVFEPCRLIFKVVKNRSAVKFLPIIKTHILPYTMIMTHEWRSYSKIPDIPGMHYQHLTVCHKQYFVDPITGACTNTVESMWSHSRRWLPQGGARKQFINDYL
jgi:hypothetical protein